MAGVFRGASRDDRFPSAMNADGGPHSAAIPARNVTVRDAPVDEAPDVPPVFAERVRVEEPCDAVKAEGSVSAARKIKGAAQMAGGAALVAVGVPLCVLPGPGAVSIAGGAALASKGQRNFTGREATPLEAKLDEAAEKLGAAAKAQVSKTMRDAFEKTPEMAGKAARMVARKAPQVVGAAARVAAENAPKAAEAVTKTAPVIVERTVRVAPEAADRAARIAKAGVGAAARGASAVARMGGNLVKEDRKAK